MRPYTRCVSAGRRRRGMAVLVVLLMISVALAVAYVSMRSQTMTLQVQRNATLRASARDAAMAGMAIALKTMQTSSWAGVSTTLSSYLEDGQRFEATYTTGDASLDSSDEDYDEYPYRVTIAVTGYAADSGSGGREISHHTSAVVRLVPRKLATEPTGWSDITNYTLCQWSAGTFMITVPSHIHGPTRIRGAMDLSQDDIPYWTDDMRWWYFYGLSKLQEAGYSDRRPFTGPVYLPFASQRSATYNLLYSALWASPTDTSSTTTVSWPSATLPSGYRLYAGGQLYTATVLGSTLQNTTLGPDPKSNPLGAFYRTGTLTVSGNVSLRGTIFLAGGACADLVVAGTNVSLNALDLPPLVDSSGTEVPVRLPTIFAGDDVQFSDGAQATLTGLIVAIDQFIVDRASPGNTSVTVTGKVTARDIEIYRRYGWYLSSLTWANYFSAFHTQRSTGIAYFPTFLAQKCDLPSQPVVSIDPDEGEVKYHWQDPSNPIYVPHSDDLAEGVALRWEVVRWGD